MRPKRIGRMPIIADGFRQTKCLAARRRLNLTALAAYNGKQYQDKILEENYAKASHWRRYRRVRRPLASIWSIHDRAVALAGPEGDRVRLGRRHLVGF